MAPSNALRAPPRPFLKRKQQHQHQRRQATSSTASSRAGTPGAGAGAGASAATGTSASVAVKPDPEINEANYKTYPLKACNKDEIQNIRTHLLKFQSKNPVDVGKFNKPIRLHRKETRNLQYQLTRAEIEQRQKEYAEEKLKLEEEAKANEIPVADGNGGFYTAADYDLTNDPNVAPDPVKTQEQKLLEKKNRQMQHIAPDGGARKNKQALKRKTRQIRAVSDEIKTLRYEEYYPWVMEDYDGKNTYVGNYEAGTSDSYALLIFDSNGFRLAPVDKVYKFTPRNKYSTLTLEEAEAKMESKAHVPRWLMKHLDDQEQKMTRYERTKQKLKTVQGTKDDDRGERDSDNDDLDFEEDFADDEEAPIIDGDEQENKESEAKIKREMRSANLHGDNDVEVGDDDVDDDLFGERKVFDKDGEKLRKTLLKTEAGGMYESDDEENPYLNDSDVEKDEDEEEEIIKADLSKPVSLVGQSSRQSSPPVNRIKVKSVNRPIGVVVLKALPSVLVKFPKGDWNPYAKKRFAEENNYEDDQISKKIKLEEPSSSVKLEQEITIPQDDDALLTEEDIINIVKVEKVTAKELIARLKPKLSRHPDNKNRIKLLVKKLLKNENGFLILKSN
jgi:transcription initiation factor TFIIF subunit alpha